MTAARTASQQSCAVLLGEWGWVLYTSVMRFMKTRNSSVVFLLASLSLLGGVLLVRHCREEQRKDDSNTERGVAKIPLTIMKGTGFLTFDARVNGRKIRMAIDTAANTTCFDVYLVKELQLEDRGKTGTSFRLASSDLPLVTAYVKDFRVGSLSYHGDFPFVDLSRPNRGVETAGDTPIEGLLGADILIKWNAIIDYKELCLVIQNLDIQRP